jgi:hypothetical protein
MFSLKISCASQVTRTVFRPIESPKRSSVLLCGFSFAGFAPLREVSFGSESISMQRHQGAKTREVKLRH